MKVVQSLIAALLLAGMMFAQASTPASAPQQAAPAASSKPQPKQKQAKSQQEYADFQAIQGAADGAAADALAKQFEQKYAQSELNDLVAFVVMSKYRVANNEDKTLEWGRKALTYDPNNIQALLLTADVLAHTTHKLDLDRDQKLAELTKSAKHAIELIDAGELVNQGATPEQAKQAEAIAFSSLGHVNSALEDYASAEPYLRKALDAQGQQPDAVTLLDLAVTLDHMNRYPDALPFASRAAQVAAASPGYEQIAESARNETKRLQQLTSAPPATAPGKPAATPSSTH